MGSNCCKGEAGTQVYKGNGTEISIGPRQRKSPVYVEMMREETFQVDETPHFGAPFFLRKLSDYTVLVGTKAKLSVHISNTKDVKVTWLKDEVPLAESERYVCTSKGQLHSLDIATVLPEDNAKWSCQAENLLGKCVCSGQLTVRVPETYKAPEFVDELRAILTSQGTISLECKVIGYPTPELRWYKDEKEIKAGDMFGLSINGGDLASLGVYTCVATNCVGRSRSSSKVRVQEQDTIAKEKTIDKISPVFIEELERIKGKIGDRLELRCKINLSAAPLSVRWYNQNGLIEANEKYSIFEDGLGCFLVDINAAELCDAGEWKCVITCKDGLIGITTNVVELDVPRNYRAPRFMEGLKAVMTDEGLVSFECKVIGFPTPILRWYKDGRELKPGDVYHLTGVNSLGSYCCVARNSLGEASSTTFLSVNDIKAQLNEEEWLNLLQVNQAPVFKQGLNSRDVNIAEPFRLTVVVSSVSKPTVCWYKDDLVVDGSDNCKLTADDSTYTYHLDVVVAQLDDQGEWKCVASNEFGQAGTSCFVKLIIPKHYRKPKFLENLKAVMLRDGTVNLECKVIGVPQPVLKWYKDGTELKPGDIHRIITGQDGKCCLGTYTCEAVNCMGSVSSTASLHGYDGIADEGPLPPEGAAAGPLVKDASLSTIHEERTSQMFDTAASYESAASNGRGEISFTFDGKEVSVSLYETPELTNDEALQIVQMFADQLHQNINENENVTSLPSLRFVKETSTSGQLVMEALVIDVPVVEDSNVFEDDRRTDFDIDEMHDENTFTFESGIASSKVRTHRQSSGEQDEFRSMTPSDHSDLEQDVMMSILSRDSLPVLTSPAKTTDGGGASGGADTAERLLSLVETVVFHLASIREEVRNQTDLAMTPSFLERSEKILADILYPVQQLHKQLAGRPVVLESLLGPVEHLARGLSVVEKCVQIGGYSRTFVYRTSVCIVEGCGKQILNCLTDMRLLAGQQPEADFVTQQKIYMALLEVQTSIESAQESIQSQRILQEADSVAAMQDLSSIVTNRSIFEDIDFILKADEPIGGLQIKNLQITVLEFEKSLATILTIVSQSDSCNVRSEIARFGLTEVLLELKNKTEVLLVQSAEPRQQRIVAEEMKPAVTELSSLVELVEASASYAEVITCLNDMFVPLEEMKAALSKLSSELRHVPEREYSSNQALEQQIEEFYEMIVHLKEEIQRTSKEYTRNGDVFVRLEDCLNRLFCIHTADSIDDEECARMEIVLIQLLMNHLTKLELALQEKSEQEMLSYMSTAFLNVHDNLQHFSYMRSNNKYEKIRQDILQHARKMVFFLIERESSVTATEERRKAIYEIALFSIHNDSARMREGLEKDFSELLGDADSAHRLLKCLHEFDECATLCLKTHEQSVFADNEAAFASLLKLATAMRQSCETVEDQIMNNSFDHCKVLTSLEFLHAAADDYSQSNENGMALLCQNLCEDLNLLIMTGKRKQVKSTDISETVSTSTLDSLKTSVIEIRKTMQAKSSTLNIEQPLSALECTINELGDQHMQLDSVELMNAIATPIAKVTETLKNIDLQSAHVEPTVVMEDCLLQMCESLEKAQSEHSLEQAKEDTVHSKLLETVTHVQHDIRECIEIEKDAREKHNSSFRKEDNAIMIKKEEEETKKKKEEEDYKEMKEEEKAKKTKDEEEAKKMKEEAEASNKKSEEEYKKKIDETKTEKKAEERNKKKEEKEAIKNQKEKEAIQIKLDEEKKEAEEINKNQKEEEAKKKQREQEVKKKKEEEDTKKKKEEEEARKKKEEEEVKKKAEEKAKKKMEEEEAKKKQDEEAAKKKKEEEEARKKKEEVETRKKKEEEEAKKKQEEEAAKKKKEEEEAKKKEEEEAKKKKEAEEAKKKKEAADAKKNKEEEAKKKAEEEAKKKKEEEVKKMTEDEAKKKMEEEEAKKKEEEEAKKKKAEEEGKKKKAEEEAMKKKEEEAIKKKKEEEEAKKKAEEEAKKKKEEEEAKKKKAEEEDKKKKAEEEARKKKEEEKAKKKMEEAEAKKKKEEEEAKKKKEEEEAKKKKEEEEVKKKKAEEEAKKKKEEEATKKKKEEEKAKKKQEEEEAKKKNEAEEVKKKQEEEAAKKKKEEEEVKKKKTEEEAKKKEEEEIKKKKEEEEAKKKQEEEEANKKKAEDEAKKKKAEEEARKKMEMEETKKKMEEEEAKKKEEEEVEKKKKEEEAKKKKVEEDAEKKKAEDEAKKKKAEDEAKKKKAEEEAKKKKEEEEAKKKMEEEEAKKKKEEEEAQKKREEDAAIKKKEEEEFKKKAEEEAKKKKEEDAAKKKKEEEEAKKKKEEEEAKKKKADEESKKNKAEEEAKKKKEEEEAKKKQEEEVKKKKEEEVKKKAEEEAKKKKEEEEIKKKEEEGAKKKKAEKEAKEKKEEEEAKKKKEEEEGKKKKEEEEAKKKKAEEDAKKKKAEDEAKKKKAEEEAKKKKEEEEAKKKKEEEEAKKKKEEEEVKKKAEEEAKKKKEEEDAKKKKEEEEAKKKKEEEAAKKKKVEEEAKKKKEEEEAKKKKEEEEVKKKKAEEEAKKKKEEEDAKKKQDEEAAKKKKEEEEAKKKKEEEEAKKKKAEEEAKKKKEEEAAKKKKVEEEAKKKKEEEEVKKKKEEEAAKKKKEEEEAKKKKEEEEAKKKKEEEEVKKKKAEEEAKKKKEEEDAKKKKAEEEAKKKKEEENAKKKKEEEEARKKKEIEETKKKAEAEAKRKKEEEDIKKKKEEEEANKKEKTKKKEEEEIKEKDEKEKTKQKKTEAESKKQKEEDEAKKTIQKEENTKKKAEEEKMRKKSKKTEEAEVRMVQETNETKQQKKEDEVQRKIGDTAQAAVVMMKKSEDTIQQEKTIAKVQTVLDNVHELLLEIKRMFLTNSAGKNLSSALKNVKLSMMTSADLERCEVQMPLVKHFHAPIATWITTLSQIDLYSAQSETWKVLEDSLLQLVDSFGQLPQRSEQLQVTEWRTVYTLYKTVMVLLTEVRQCIYQRRSTQAEAELALSKTSVELQLLQKDLEYIQLNFGSDRVDLTSKTVQSYFVQICKSLTLLHPSVVATVQKPSYATCVNILQQLTIPVHDLVSVLPPSTSAGDAEALNPALKHNLRQLYRIVSLISQQHLTRVRNEREVTIVEEIKRQLLSLDRLLKALLDLHSKTEQQKDLLEMVRKNLATLKSVMLQVRTTCCLQTLVEKDDQLLGAFELVIERLTVNPLQLDSVEYLRLLAESLERYCDVMRRLGSNGTISDWLLRYQLQLLKIFDTIEFCLSEEQFIVIGSKEKYTRTSTQDAIHAVKQLITHYKIASSQEVRREQKSEQTHIQLIATRQGLTDEAESVTGGGRERSARRTVDARQSRADAVRRHATRSPVGQRDDPPRSSSRCSLGALPSKRGPSFAVYLKNVFIERDHSFKLLCVVLDSEIDVRWTKDGSDIAPTGRYHMVQKNGLITLQVDHAEYEDTGVYACHVFNNYGQSFNKCTVEVYDTSDDIICPSFSIPHQMEYQQASTNHYTDKSYTNTATVSGHSTISHQRSSTRSTASAGYDHTKVKEYYRRHQQHTGTTADQHHAYSSSSRESSRQTTFEHRRSLRASTGSSSYHHLHSSSSPYYYGSMQGLGHLSHGESLGRDVTTSSDVAARQRRSYLSHYDRLTTTTTTGTTMRKSPTVTDQQQHQQQQGLTKVERTEWRSRDWARIKRTSPTVMPLTETMEDDTAASGRHSVGGGRGSSSGGAVQATTSTTESAATTTREESKSQRTAQLQVSTEMDRTTTTVGGKRSQTYPYHYRMDTFATTLSRGHDSQLHSSLEMYQPIVQTVLRDRLVKRGSNLLLVCSFWGVNCEIEWVHNYTKLSSGAKYRISRHQGMSILEIYDITHQEAGMYKCVVRNDCGEDVTNCCILVLDHIRLSSTKQTRPDRHTLTRRF